MTRFYIIICPIYITQPLGSPLSLLYRRKITAEQDTSFLTSLRIPNPISFENLSIGKVKNASSRSQPHRLPLNYQESNGFKHNIEKN